MGVRRERRTEASRGGRKETGKPEAGGKGREKKETGGKGREKKETGGKKDTRGGIKWSLVSVLDRVVRFFRCNVIENTCASTGCESNGHGDG